MLQVAVAAKGPRYLVQVSALTFVLVGDSQGSLFSSPSLHINHHCQPSPPPRPTYFCTPTEGPILPPCSHSRHPIAQATAKQLLRISSAFRRYMYIISAFVCGFAQRRIVVSHRRFGIYRPYIQASNSSRKMGPIVCAERYRSSRKTYRPYLKGQAVQEVPKRRV